MSFWPSSVATNANLYVASNALQTTLSGAINNAVTTITLASTTGFPTAGAVTIDNEVIFYTNISGAQLTGCTRAADGTTAASHSSGVPVGATVIAFHHNGLKDEIIAVETYLDTVLGKGTSVTATEFAYVHGVTSAIQTQFGYLNSYVNVKSYGATGNGSTDDTTAIQAALTAMSSTGGVLFFPAGNYKFSTLTISNNITIFGMGSEVTSLTCSGTSGIAVELGSNSTRVIIKGIKFAHANSANTLTAIHATTIREFFIDEYAFEFFKFGIQFEEPVNCVIGQGRFSGLNNTTGTGIILGSTANVLSATATDIKDAYISGYNIGISIEEGTTNRIRGIFENCTQPILAHSSTNARTMLYNTHFETNVTSAVLITATGSAEIFADGIAAYESGTYVSDWSTRVSGNVMVLTNDQLYLPASSAIQIGVSATTGQGKIALANEKAFSGTTTGGTVVDLIRLDSANQLTLTANSLPLRIQSAAVQTTIGANGAASALTALPVGYLKVTIAGVDRIIPYYSA